MSEKAGPEVVEPTTTVTTELVVVEGRLVDAFNESMAGGTFVPALRKDMPLAQRKDAVRQVLTATRQVDDRLNLMQGEMLFEVSRNSYWKDWTFTDDSGETRPFANFEEYLNSELDMQRRKAFYLIGIYDKFVVELNLPKEILMSLEWSKAKEVTGVINAENWADIIDKMKTLSVRQLKDWVKALKKPATPATAGAAPGAEGGAAPGTEGTGTTADSEPDVSERITFKLTAEQLANVKSALSVAESMGAGDKPGNQLDLICSNFVASAVGVGVEGALATLDVLIKSIERSFGVSLELKGIDEARYAELPESGGTAEAAPDEKAAG